MAYIVPENSGVSPISETRHAGTRSSGAVIGV
jgi:hypothetical protein